MSIMLDATFHLVLKRTGRNYPRLAARLTQRRPNLAAGEVAVELTIAVPAALFERPSLRAKVEVPDGQAPTVITAEVQDNIARALSEQLGVTVHITTDQEPQQAETQQRERV